MVFNQSDHNCDKQFGVDVITETIISTQTTFVTLIKSSKGTEFPKRACDHGCYILWIVDLYFTTQHYY